MNRRLGLLSLLAPLATAASADSRRVLHVGPARSVRTVAEAAILARDGDRIEIDAGDYAADVAVWRQDDIELVAAGGRVRLRANGAAAEGKGIWVVRGGRVAARGFDFSGAAVPSRNGAGIRFEAGRLTVRDCSFIGNEMGLLTNNDPQAVLEVENCEFAHNFRPDGHNHNLYAGRIARLSVVGSYFHHAQVGHLLKSRAAESDICCNRLTDEESGRASYELEFPNGGVARVVGNIVAQSAQTENPALISFGAEGYAWPANELVLVHNTLIDRPVPPGTWLAVRAGAGVAMQAADNLLVGDGAASDLFSTARGNVFVGHAAFARQRDENFRIFPGSPLARRSLPAPDAAGANATLAQRREYVHPHGTVVLNASAHNPGAMQTPAVRPR